MSYNFYPRTSTRNTIHSQFLVVVELACRETPIGGVGLGSTISSTALATASLRKPAGLDHHSTRLE